MYRSEYPRPHFIREHWENLNGTWDFCFEKEEWQKIEVPFAFQAPLSGIGDNRMCDSVYYKRSFQINKEWKDKKVILHFGAVDYQCRVYVNQKMAGEHIGGNIGFSFDITDALTWDTEEIYVEVYDPCEDETIPRGKQYWKEHSDSIWYTRTSGIWQTVWVEAVNKTSFEGVRFTPDIDKGNVLLEFNVDGEQEGAAAEIAVSFRGENIAEVKMNVMEQDNAITIDLFHHKIFRTCNHGGGGWCWTPENPHLFDVEMRLITKDGIDEIKSYFGMRKIETKDGMVYLNNRPYYQKLILDQGYFGEGLLTAKEDADFKRDIEMAKTMGFNGCRKHQKAEDPRFLYYADTLGFLVWSEIGSCASYSFEASQRTITEWSQMIKRDYNHPCIVAWVVLNESWGVPNICFDRKQQAHSLALYYNARSLDNTRLVISNDGWELTKSDICAIHNYAHGASEEKAKQEAFRKMLSDKENLLFSMPSGRPVYAEGFSYEGEPILLTEFGGLSYAADKEKGWGYTTIENKEEFIETYRRILKDIMDSENIYGFCYTQLCDVEQEVNGLLTENRQYKVNPEEIKKINDSVFKTKVF